MTRYTFYASVGPPVKSLQDPIYTVANHFPPSSMRLFTSDELDTGHTRGTVEDNFNLISDYFGKAGVQVKLNRLNMNHFDENVISIASQIIKDELTNHDPIVFDLTAGRGAISHAMARAAQLIVDYYRVFTKQNITIQCAIQPFNSDLITFEIGQVRLPNKKDLELLMIVEKRVSQTQLAKELNWNNQSEVSKSITRLVDKGLLEQKGYSDRKLTDMGKHFRRFLKNIQRL